MVALGLQLRSIIYCRRRLLRLEICFRDDQSGIFGRLALDEDSDPFRLRFDLFFIVRHTRYLIVLIDAINKLRVVEFSIEAVLREQLLMRALLHDIPLANNKNCLIVLKR